MVAGQEPDVLNGAEGMLPLAISGPEILAETMQRRGVLSLILGRGRGGWGARGSAAV